MSELFITGLVLLLLQFLFKDSISLESIFFLDTMRRLRKLLSTKSSSSTSAAKSDQSVKEKGSCFKVYIHLTILKNLNPRRIQDSREHVSRNALRK